MPYFSSEISEIALTKHPCVEKNRTPCASGPTDISPERGTEARPGRARTRPRVADRVEDSGARRCAPFHKAARKFPMPLLPPTAPPPPAAPNIQFSLARIMSGSLFYIGPLLGFALILTIGLWCSPIFARACGCFLNNPGQTATHPAQPLEVISVQAESCSRAEEATDKL
jgi:hypothetical protein